MIYYFVNIYCTKQKKTHDNYQFQLSLIDLLNNKIYPLYDNIWWKEIFFIPYNHTKKR